MIDGYRADGCGQTWFSASTDGPWAPLECASWEKLVFDDCVYRVRNAVARRQGVNATGSASMNYVARCEHLQQVEGQRCRAQAPLEEEP